MTDGDLTISHDANDGVEIIRLEGDVDLLDCREVAELLVQLLQLEVRH